LPPSSLAYSLFLMSSWFSIDGRDGTGRLVLTLNPLFSCIRTIRIRTWLVGTVDNWLESQILSPTWNPNGVKWKTAGWLFAASAMQMWPKKSLKPNMGTHIPKRDFRNFFMRQVCFVFSQGHKYVRIVASRHHLNQIHVPIVAWNRNHRNTIFFEYMLFLASYICSIPMGWIL